MKKKKLTPSGQVEKMKGIRKLVFESSDQFHSKSHDRKLANQGVCVHMYIPPLESESLWGGGIPSKSLLFYKQMMLIWQHAMFFIYLRLQGINVFVFLQKC